MAVSIKLKFPAECIDCGASLPVGTRARWLGNGRVSCCGESRSPSSPKAEEPAPRTTTDWQPPQAALDRVAKLEEELAIARSELIAAGLPNKHGRKAQLLAQLKAGLNHHELRELSELAPETMVLVRLQSGKRFIASADSAPGLIRALEESMLERVRDVLTPELQ